MRIVTTIAIIDKFEEDERKSFENVRNHIQKEFDEAREAGRYCCFRAERDENNDLIQTYEYENENGFLINKEFHHERNLAKYGKIRQSIEK